MLYRINQRKVIILEIVRPITIVLLDDEDHRLFSYFLMKELEGDEDPDNDKKINNGELHSHMRSHVTRQAVRIGREQTPQLQGDESRVLVGFN